METVSRIIPEWCYDQKSYTLSDAGSQSYTPVTTQGVFFISRKESPIEQRMRSCCWFCWRHAIFPETVPSGIPCGLPLMIRKEEHEVDSTLKWIEANRAGAAGAIALMALGLFVSGPASRARAEDAAPAEIIYSDPGDKQAGRYAASSEPVAEETGDNAFKAGTDGKWLGNFDDTGAWIAYGFKDAGYAVGRYRIISGNDAPERDPKAWKVCGSNDNKEWTTLDERKDQAFSDRGVAKTYRIKNPAVYKYYRLVITANNGSTEDNQGGKGLVQLARWLLLNPGPNTGEVIITDADANDQGGTASASTEPVDVEKSENAFMIGTKGKWLGTVDDNGAAWLQYTFNGAGYAASKYRIISANDSPERDPKAWKLCGSNDAKEWSTLDEQKDQAFDDRFVAKNYTIKTPAVYKYYRLAISANNGSTEDNQGGKGLVQLSELDLIK